MSAQSPITAHFQALTSGQSPAREIGGLNAHFQHDNFFHLAVAQEARRAQLKERFSRTFRGKVFITQFSLGRAEIEWPGAEVHFVPDGKLLELAASGALRNAILIANNNDLVLKQSLDAYLEFFQKTVDTIIAVWDFDNHHWYPSSAFLASHCDIYFPCHPDNTPVLARYNRCIHGPITAGVTQWTKGFLRDSAGQISSLLRSEQPLGMHVHYEQFRFRNQVINTLAQHYPDTVGFQTGYHDISDSERMRRWCAHKAHWTVPVLNDIPIRIFDALSTGGVAIVADSLKHLPIISALAEHFVFYRATDIVEPRAIVEEANRKFDAGGLEKVLERHRLGVEHHHVSTRIERILQTVFDEFELPKSARKV